VARTKAPDVDFRRGRLQALPIEDSSVDLVVCMLALTHVDDLDPVFAEFARVVRPGGWVVTSDMHPFMTMFGGVAAFPTGEQRLQVDYVPNLTHPPSSYINAFLRAGLSIEQCIEPPATTAEAAAVPSFPFVPDATEQAFVGRPYLLIWQLTK
jgi:ubiquinone/menaquinone biosynthesis C-methylase UbiE